MSTAVVAETADEVQATIWVDALGDAGIRAAKLEAGPGGAFGGAQIFARYRVLVDRSRLGEARNIIAEMGSGADIAPVGDATTTASALRVFGMLVLLVALGLGGVLLGQAIWS